MKAIKALYFCTVLLQLFLMVILGMTVLSTHSTDNVATSHKMATPLSSPVALKP